MRRLTGHSLCIPFSLVKLTSKHYLRKENCQKLYKNKRSMQDSCQISCAHLVHQLWWRHKAQHNTKHSRCQKCPDWQILEDGFKIFSAATRASSAIKRSLVNSPAMLNIQNCQCPSPKKVSNFYLFMTFLWPHIVKQHSWEKTTLCGLSNGTKTQ